MIIPNYVYNIVYKNRGLTWRREPQSFLGSAQDFAQKTLLTWISNNSENADELVVVNVWDADQEGAGDPANLICQVTNHQLDEGPFDPDQINVDYGQYYIHSAEYDFHADPM